MKKAFLFVLVLIVAISVLVTGCSKAKDSYNDIMAAGKIRVGLDDTFAPMGFRDPDTNELIGFDIDFARAIGEKMGLEIEFVPTDWTAVFASLDAKKFDVIINGCSVSEERKELADFSPAYMVNKQIVAIKEGSSVEIASVEDLKDKKISLQNGSTSDEAVKKAGLDANAVKYETNYLALEDLKAGRVDCAVSDEIYVRDYVVKNGGITVLDVFLLEEPYAIGFRKSDKEFQKAVNAAVQELKEDGTLTNISMKWFGEDIVEK